MFFFFINIIHEFSAVIYCECSLISFLYVTMIQLTIEECVLVIKIFYRHNESYAKTVRNFKRIMI